MAWGARNLISTQVIKGQNLTRAEQVKFTGLLGENVALAKSFYGKDPEPNQPSILRVTNF